MSSTADGNSEVLRAFPIETSALAVADLKAAGNKASGVVCASVCPFLEPTLGGKQPACQLAFIK